MEGTIQKYVEIGVKFIAIPYLMEEDRPGTPQGSRGNVKLFEEIGKACKAHGIQTLYHNHDFEFVKMPDGRYALDYIYDTIPADLLQTEVDTCWVKVSGEDPAAYIKKYHRPLPCGPSQGLPQGGQARQHVPSLIGTTVKEEESHGVFEFRPVGHGDQDFPPILEASVEAGAQWVVVEQDQSIGRTPHGSHHPQPPVPEEPGLVSPWPTGQENPSALRAPGFGRVDRTSCEFRSRLACRREQDL